MTEHESIGATLETLRYTERDTHTIYDVQLFEDAVMVRKIGTGVIELLSISDFEDRFDECAASRH